MKSLEIVTKPEPIVIGLPVNGQLSQDLQLLKDVLRLEGNEGRFFSPLFKDAIFRTLRVQDVANLLYDPDGKINCGIVGLDTMIETRLQLRNTLKEKYRYANEAWLTPEVRKRIFDALTERVTQVFQLQLGGKEPMMSFLIREEDEQGLLSQNEPTLFAGENPPQVMVTSYPNIAQSSTDVLRKKVRWPRIQKVNGQVESLVRNQDFGPTLGGLDIVRSGKTAQKFRLKPFGQPILVSKPGLYRRQMFEQKERGGIYADFAQSLAESCRAAQIPIEDGSGTDFVKSLQPWSLNSERC